MQKIQQTEDYSSFKRIAGNRTINKAQVGKLYNSFNEYPELAQAVPLIVNDKMEIVDGQHRFQALKKLKLPINFIKFDGLQLKDVQIVNSATRVWNPVDYAKSFSELGNKNYATYLDFKKRYKLSHSILIEYLTGTGRKSGTNTVASFRSGKFEVGDVELAHKLCTQLQEVGQYYKKFDTRAFALAFRRVATHPEYDHARMLAKARDYNQFFQEAGYPEDYMRQLEKVYNHRNRAGVGRVKLF